VFGIHRGPERRDARRVGGVGMQITFQALIKKIEIKSLVSLDKAGRLIIDFNAEDIEIANRLNELMRADETVQITIKDVH